ncbi:MAG TPA: glycine betaine ABC transporter substrate-binding protein [Thermodesulfobacteriota bacterium]|nr:glycine betaine ABC transporter substrate-binding protein [Thermodesulfobacteriota bacterium]
MRSNLKRSLPVFILVTFCFFDFGSAADPRIPFQVGSKKFTESVILGEMVTLLAESRGVPVIHHAQLGGTRILWDALRRGDIDVYPEYTGTIIREILAGEGLRREEEVRRSISRFDILMSRPLGFNNTYALGVKEDVAERLGITTISDLRRHPQLKFGFANEFMNRQDGWPGLRQTYRLPQENVRGLEHELAYVGLQSGAIQVMDLYSTDAEIAYYHLRTLKDDLHFFPAYDAVLLYRSDLVRRWPQGVLAILGLEGKISESSMREMNEQAKINKIPAGRVAASFIRKEIGVQVQAGDESWIQQVILRTREHLSLVAISLGAAIALSIPLGILAARYSKQGQIILGAVGIIQTVPSMALLVFMIPLLGIGSAPAILALFLYSLLPIVRSTHSGLKNIPLDIRESAEALGLPYHNRLWMIELPLASHAILSGIKTSAVINVGTATLGALIGAGGYGQPILTGIRLDDMGLILEGAIPAAGLALAVQGVFDLAERYFVPKGLRLAPEE